MKGIRNGRTQEPENPLDLLQDTGSGGDSLQLAWRDVDTTTLTDLLDSVSGAGGIVTLGAARSDGGLYWSARFGDKKRAYAFTTVDQFKLQAKPLIDACKRMRLRAVLE